EVKLVSVAVDDSILSCDNDGLLDGTEKGKVTVTIRNTGAAPLMGTTMTVTTSTVGATLPNGNTATFPDLAPFQTGTAFVEVDLDNSFMAIANLNLAVVLNNNSACTKTQTNNSVTQINYDNVLNASATDDVESLTPVWNVTNALGPA